MESPQRRETDMLSRLDQQDKVLDELHNMMIEHRASHAHTDPAVDELVNILKGMKMMKQLALVLASIVGSAWAFFTFVWDHIHFTK